MQIKENTFTCADISEMLREIPENNADAILTDPPYPREFIECWSGLSEFGNKVLKNGRFLFAYSGQLNLPEVYKRMGEKMKYVWQFALLHNGGSQAVHPSHVMCGYKPILVYCKDKPCFPDVGYFKDTIPGTGREKSNHPWEQSADELVRIILHYTKPNDLIIDPFCGSGTTGIACYKTGRRFICSDKEEKWIRIAQQRFNDLTAQTEAFGEETRAEHYGRFTNSTQQPQLAMRFEDMR